MMIIKKSILILCGLLFSLILVELVIRLTPSLRSKYQLCRYVVKEKEDINHVEALNETYRRSGQYLYRPSTVPGLGYELIPHMQAEREVNSYGMVCKEYPINKSPNVYRILVLGDSITQEYSFVKNLEAMLNDASANLVFELWNAGVGGYKVNQFAACLKYKGVLYKPDMVIMNLDLNDFGLDTVVYYETKDGIVGYRNAGYQLSKMIPLNKWYFIHSYLYRFIIINLENLLFNPTEEYKDNMVNTQREGKYHIKLIKDICVKHNIYLIGIIFPYLKPLGEYTDGERGRYKMILDSLRDLDINLVDLHGYIPEENRYIFRRNKQDLVHLTPEGYKVAATAVFGYLAKNYLKELSLRKQ